MDFGDKGLIDSTVRSLIQRKEGRCTIPYYKGSRSELGRCKYFEDCRFNSIFQKVSGSFLLTLNLVIECK